MAAAAIPASVTSAVAIPSHLGRLGRSPLSVIPGNETPRSSQSESILGQEYIGFKQKLDWVLLPFCSQSLEKNVERLSRISESVLNESLLEIVLDLLKTKFDEQMSKESKSKRNIRTLCLLAQSIEAKCIDNDVILSPKNKEIFNAIKDGYSSYIQPIIQQNHQQALAKRAQLLALRQQRNRPHCVIKNKFLEYIDKDSNEVTQTREIRKLVDNFKKTQPENYQSMSVFIAIYKEVERLLSETDVNLESINRGVFCVKVLWDAVQEGFDPAKRAILLKRHASLILDKDTDRHLQNPFAPIKNKLPYGHLARDVSALTHAFDFGKTTSEAKRKRLPNSPSRARNSGNPNFVQAAKKRVKMQVARLLRM